MKMAAQSLLQETNVLGCGARRALWNGSSRMVFARPHSSVGSIGAVTAGPEQRVLRFGAGRLPYSSQLSVASEGGRKVSTGAAAVRYAFHFPRSSSSSLRSIAVGLQETLSRNYRSVSCMRISCLACQHHLYATRFIKSLLCHES